MGGTTVDIVMSPNPKKKRIFIKPNGEKIEGGIEEALGGKMGDDMGGAGRTEGVSKQPKKSDKK